MSRLFSVVFALGFSLSALGSGQWSIAQVGDIHSLTYCTSNQWRVFRDFILSNTNDGDFNFKVVVIPGDLYDQLVIPSSQPNSTEDPPLLHPTNLFNDLDLIKAQGLLVLPCTGNHDCDEKNAYPNNSSGSKRCVSGAAWNEWFPVSWYSNYPGYKGTRVADDSRNVAVTYTNGSTKLLFLTLSWATNNFAPWNIARAYLSQIQWATNQLRLYPDHWGVVLAHHLLSTNELFETWDTRMGILYTNVGPGPAIFTDRLSGCSNLFLLFSGHNRLSLKAHRNFLNKAHNTVCAVEWNTQGFTNHAEMFSVVTFNPERQKVTFRSYDIYTSSFMTNGQASFCAPGDYLGWRTFTHTWEIPFPAQTPAKRFAKHL